MPLVKAQSGYEDTLQLEPPARPDVSPRSVGFGMSYMGRHVIMCVFLPLVW